MIGVYPVWCFANLDLNSGTQYACRSIMAELRAEFPGITANESAELPYDKEGWCKVITIANVIDFDKMQEVMALPKVLEWDKKYNNTDIVYKLERIN